MLKLYVSRVFTLCREEGFRDHYQDNHECTDRKTDRGYANTALDDWSNGKWEGLSELSDFPGHGRPERFQLDRGVEIPRESGRSHQVRQIQRFAWNQEPFVRTAANWNPHSFPLGRQGGHCGHSEQKNPIEITGVDPVGLPSRPVTTPGKESHNMNVLLICPKFPDTFWSFTYAFSFIGKNRPGPMTVSNSYVARSSQAKTSQYNQ